MRGVLPENEAGRHCLRTRLCSGPATDRRARSRGETAAGALPDRELWPRQDSGPGPAGLRAEGIAARTVGGAWGSQGGGSLGVSRSSGFQVGGCWSRSSARLRPRLRVLEVLLPQGPADPRLGHQERPCVVRDVFTGRFRLSPQTSPPPPARFPGSVTPCKTAPAWCREGGVGTHGAQDGGTHGAGCGVSGEPAAWQARTGRRFQRDGEFSVFP